MKSLKVKIKLDYNQELIINTLSNEHRLLYNHLLYYCKNNKLDFKSLNNEYKNYRNENKLTINSKSAQNTCINLINNIKSYLSLKKNDKTAKFPNKFKSHKYFTSFQYDINNNCGGFKIKNDQLIINLIGLKENSKKLIINLNNYTLNLVNMNNIKTIIIKKENNDYYLCFTYLTINKENILNKDNFLSIDPGMKNIVTGFTNKNEWFKIKNRTFKSLEKQVSECKSKLDKKIKFSKKWYKLHYRFIQLTKKLTNSNKDFQHKVSNQVVKYCVKNDIGKIIIGDIETKKLVKENLTNNKGIKGFNKSSQNRGTLSRLQTFIDYKAVNENIDFYNQEESYTSKTNSLTDKLFNFNLSLKDRKVKLDNDLIIDRDLNGSINIAKKAKVEWFNQIDLKDYLLNINQIYINNLY